MHFYIVDGNGDECPIIRASLADVMDLWPDDYLENRLCTLPVGRTIFWGGWEFTKLDNEGETMTPEQIDILAGEIYAQNVERGWWDDPDRDIVQTLQLVNTEIAEATEADRKNAMDDHLPHRKGVEVELADALIRLLDLAGRFRWGYVYNKAVFVPGIRATENLAARHLWLTRGVCELAMAYVSSSGVGVIEQRYGALITSILYIADQEEYDIWGAVREKLDYNKTRADHGRETRAEFDGKRY